MSNSAQATENDEPGHSEDMPDKIHTGRRALKKGLDGSYHFVFKSDNFKIDKNDDLPQNAKTQE